MPQPTTIHQTLWLDGDEVRANTRRTGGRDRSGDGHTQRLADLTRGRGHGGRYSGLSLGHSYNGRVRNRRIDHAEADPEQEVGR